MRTDLYDIRGAIMLHLPTNRPCKIVEVTQDSMTVHTLDDVWVHPKTGKPWGGSAWVLDRRRVDDFWPMQEALGL